MYQDIANPAGNEKIYIGVTDAIWKQRNYAHKYLTNSKYATAQCFLNI